MTSLQHHIVTQSHSSSSHLDNHLDALLDDLQTSVSRPGTVSAFSNLNGPNFGGHVNLPPGATGYREITTTVTRDTNGIPTTSRDYQIEYLNPANSITILDDRSSSPAIELLKSGDVTGHQLQSYKTEVYDYKFSKTTSGDKTRGFGGNQIAANDSKNLAIDSKSYVGGNPNVQGSSQFLRTEGSEQIENFQGQTNVGKNLNELDMLLKELNTTAPHKDSKDSFSKEYFQTFESQSEKIPERYVESPSSMPKRSTSSTSEITYSERTQNRSNRAQSPTILSSTPKASTRTITVQREESSRSHTSRRDSPSARNRSGEMSPILRRRTPSPSSGEFRPANFSNYPISPKDLTPTKTVTSKSYSFSSTGRRSPTPISFDEPQPYRSPSPVSFPQKRSPSPIRRNLNRTDSGRSTSYQVKGGDRSQGSSEFTHKIEYAREYRERPDGDLQRSPSFERNLRPSNVKITQSYANQQQQQQQQNQEYPNQYHQNEKPESFHKEYQRREEFHTREQHSGHYIQQPQQQQQQQQREHYQQSQYQQQREHFQQSQYQQQQQREHYQQSQHQQYQQNQGKYQQDSRDQYQQSQSGIQRENRELSQQGQSGYHHDQKYQYEQNKQYRQHSNQIPVNESLTSQSYRSATSSKSVAGPPVYYPPGVELFTKKEEAMLKQEQSGKKGKSKSKENKNKDKKGIKTYPACFPICCAMPCSIM